MTRLPNSESDQFLRLFTGLVRDLLRELVPLAEDFPAGLNDFFRVVVVLGEYQGLRHPLSRAPGKQVSEKSVSVAPQHGSNLIRYRNGVVQFLFRVRQVGVQLPVADGARAAVSNRHHVPGINLASLFMLAPM